jgi:hypothetical protein
VKDYGWLAVIALTFLVLKSGILAKLLAGANGTQEKFTVTNPDTVAGREPGYSGFSPLHFGVGAGFNLPSNLLPFYSSGPNSSVLNVQAGSVSGVFGTNVHASSNVQYPGGPSVGLPSVDVPPAGSAGGVGWAGGGSLPGENPRTHVYLA